MIPAFIAGKGRKEAKERAEELLAFMGLSDRASHKPAELSGGEKQRLEIARALYHNRQFILADEVKANLDFKNQEKISHLLFSLPQALVEVIHHYSEEDLKRYDKVIKLEK